MIFPDERGPRDFLKRFPFLVSLKGYLWEKFRRRRETTKLDVLQTFPAFRPYSPGRHKDRVQITIKTINQTIPFLSSLAESVGARRLRISDIQSVPSSYEETEASSELKACFDKFGSDKSNGHNYHHLYGPILRNRGKVRGVLEFGLGTNNLDVVSNMGSEGRPGASLRAFRDFLPNAKIYGADIDRGILFMENRIATFYVDQTDPATFAELGASVPSDLDLVIDDGLHSPNANIETLKFGLGKIREGGWVVIEDIGSDAIPIWELVAAVLPERFQCCLFQAQGALLFAVKRLR
jgi:hypothetical protein